ncbi:MAG: hypothetical protein LAT81_07735 [Oceanicaulis sp.]|nr:hypothetical protein [Oceanicaulis sp.]
MPKRSALKASTPTHTANAWQMELIAEGIAAAREGKVIPAEEVFARIAAKHGWPA